MILIIPYILFGDKEQAWPASAGSPNPRAGEDMDFSLRPRRGETGCAGLLFAAENAIISDKICGAVSKAPGEESCVKIQESGENYLETILILNKKNGRVRSIDVANELGYTKASVSRAMGILKEAGYLVMEPSGNLVLTAEGSRRAGAVYERHTVIAQFLEMTLGVDAKTAVQDSCRIEHIISEESFRRIKQYVAGGRPGKAASRGKNKGDIT